MRKQVVVLGAAVLVAGIVAAQLWMELRAERTRSTDLVARAAALEAVPPPQTLSPPAPAPQPAAPPAVAAPQATTAHAVAVTASEPVTRPAPAGQDAARAPAAGMLEAMQSPQGLEYTLSMMRGMMAQMYPDLATELDLTAEQTTQFFDLLTKQQGEIGVESMALMGGGTRDPGATREMQRKLVEKTRAHEQELAAMLGSKYPKWEEYQGTAAARQQVEQLRTTLNATGNPLSEAQSKSLVAAFATEQVRIQKQESDWMTSAAAIESPNMMQESMQRAVGSQRKLVDVATPHLTAAQANQFRRQVEQQESMLRATMGLLGGQAPTP